MSTTRNPSPDDQDPCRVKIISDFLLMIDYDQEFKSWPSETLVAWFFDQESKLLG